MSEQVNTAPRKFTLKLKEVPIQIEGTDGQTRDYVIRQMTYAGREEFNIFQDTHIKRGEDGKAKIAEWRDLYSWLVSKMLFTDKNERVPLATVREMPDQMVEDLYQICLEIQEQDGTGVEQAKNE